MVLLLLPLLPLVLLLLLVLKRTASPEIDIFLLRSVGSSGSERFLLSTVVIILWLATLRQWLVVILVLGSDVCCGMPET